MVRLVKIHVIARVLFQDFGSPLYLTTTDHVKSFTVGYHRLMTYSQTVLLWGSHIGSRILYINKNTDSIHHTNINFVFSFLPAPNPKTSSSADYLVNRYDRVHVPNGTCICLQWIINTILEQECKQQPALAPQTSHWPKLLNESWNQQKSSEWSKPDWGGGVRTNFD